MKFRKFAVSFPNKKKKLSNTLRITKAARLETKKGIIEI